ncbi:MAG: 16S rRNA (uracil(1498)-N(3))-methyltransferase [Betaproteobacteria bacterium]
MSAPRFFCAAAFVPGSRTALPEAVFHHAVRVRRLRSGDALVLFSGDGSETLVRLVMVARNEADIEVLSRALVDRESPIAVTLLQGISSGDRMDYTLQKAVELGVAAIVPVVAERSIVRLSGERAEKRNIHWCEVVISGCEQCGRNRIPEVSPVMSLGEALSVSVTAISDRFVLSVANGRRIRDCARPTGPIALLAGPEGGLSPAEESAARDAGFVALSLGPRVLRTETAAVAALAAIQALWGDG